MRLIAQRERARVMFRHAIKLLIAAIHVTRQPDPLV